MTRYGLEGPGIEFRWGQDFPHPSKPILGPSSLLYNGYRLSFPGVKRPGRGVDHPLPSNVEVKVRAELYSCYASETSWPVLWWNLPWPLPLRKNKRPRDELRYCRTQNHWHSSVLSCSVASWKFQNVELSNLISKQHLTLHQQLCAGCHTLRLIMYTSSEGHANLRTEILSSRNLYGV